MIVFETNENPGYRDRTINNASADVTLAFAIDFTTAGEKLTKNSVIEQGKVYLPIDIKKLTSGIDFIASVNACAWQVIMMDKPIITVNIAGNGLYRMKKSKFPTQASIDELTHRFMALFVKELKDVKIALIRSGGQSGFDEAGAKAGIKLGIPTLVHAPKDWVYRDAEGVDHYGEESFKKRFQ